MNITIKINYNKNLLIIIFIQFNKNKIKKYNLYKNQTMKILKSNKIL
jgi:hypothetical protein